MEFRIHIPLWILSCDFVNFHSTNNLDFRYDTYAKFEYCPTFWANYSNIFDWMVGICRVETFSLRSMVNCWIQLRHDIVAHWLSWYESDFPFLWQIDLTFTHCIQWNFNSFERILIIIIYIYSFCSKGCFVYLK